MNEITLQTKPLLEKLAAVGQEDERHYLCKIKFDIRNNEALWHILNRDNWASIIPPK